MAAAADSACWYIHKHLLCMQPPIPTFNRIKEFSAVGWRDELHSAWTCSGLSGSISKIRLHGKDLLPKGVRWIGVDHTWNEKFIDLQPPHRSKEETGSARSHGCKSPHFRTQQGGNNERACAQKQSAFVYLDKPLHRTALVRTCLRK